MPRDTAVVVVAAGSGHRLGRGNKALLPLAGEPLLAHPLVTLRACPSVAEIVVVMGEADARRCDETWGRDPIALGAHRVVDGGAARWESSRNGCLATAPDLPYLLVHDAARALVDVETIEAVVRAVREHGAALAASPLRDTLKRADADGRAASTLDREGLWQAQTPQGARRNDLLAAFSAWKEESAEPTDEAMLLEAAGHAPRLVASPVGNFKITTPDDLALAEALLRARSAAR